MAISLMHGFSSQKALTPVIPPPDDAGHAAFIVNFADAEKLAGLALHHPHQPVKRAPDLTYRVAVLEYCGGFWRLTSG